MNVYLYLVFMVMVQESYDARLRRWSFLDRSYCRCLEFNEFETKFIYSKILKVFPHKVSKFASLDCNKRVSYYFSISKDCPDATLNMISRLFFSPNYRPKFY